MALTCAAHTRCLSIHSHPTTPCFLTLWALHSTWQQPLLGDLELRDGDCIWNSWNWMIKWLSKPIMEFHFSHHLLILEEEQDLMLAAQGLWRNFPANKKICTEDGLSSPLTCWVCNSQKYGSHFLMKYRDDLLDRGEQGCTGSLITSKTRQINYPKTIWMPSLWNHKPPSRLSHSELGLLPLAAEIIINYIMIVHWELLLPGIWLKIFSHQRVSML